MQEKKIQENTVCQTRVLQKMNKAIPANKTQLKLRGVWLEWKERPDINQLRSTTTGCEVWFD